jgi:alkylation response protein AidB-like acyl-CoA dehydrogenase
MSFSKSGNDDSHSVIDLADYRAELHAWLDANHEKLAPRYAPPGTIDDRVAQMQRVKAILFDAGWMQRGWPERVGGRGGPPMLRTELGAALAARELADPGLFSLIEVLAPTLIDFAPPELAAEAVPRLLSGAELWCRASRSRTRERSRVVALPRRARGRRRQPGTRWVIPARRSGPAWPVLRPLRAAHANRPGGFAPPGHHAFFVDMDSPGITVAPLEDAQRGARVAEVFFD